MSYKLLILHNKATLLDDAGQLSDVTRDALIDAQNRYGIKLAIIGDCPQEKMEDLVDVLEMKQYGGYLLAGSGANIYNCRTASSAELYPARVVNYFMEKLDLLPEEIIAVGNDPEDVHMIQSAGLGVVMANASEAVKACADYITLSNQEDGIAHLINKYVRSQRRSVPYTSEQVNEYFADTLMSTLGITCTVLSEGYVEMIMPVTSATRQPLGILHGGANLTLAETAAGLGSGLLVEEGQLQVGVQVSGYHVGRALVGDTMRAEARILHKGKSTHVWSVEIYSMKSGKLIHTGRILNSIIKLR